MNYVDEFREAVVITKAAEEIRRLADPQQHYRFMEVCGGHTHAIYRFGLKALLPSNIELIHGPGCPVCVEKVKEIRRSEAEAAAHVLGAAFVPFDLGDYPLEIDRRAVNRP